MSDATWAIVIPAILAFLTSALAAWQSYQNKGKIQLVHTLVNSNLTTVINRVDQLTRLLTASNIPVPPKPGSEV
jgi:hypothetical protein